MTTPTTTTYLPLLEAFIVPNWVPTHKRTIKVTLNTLKQYTTNRYKVSSDTVLVFVDGVFKVLPMRTVTSILYRDELQFPELPPGVLVPPKSDRVSWLLASVRATLNDINRAALDQYGNTIVVCTEYNHLDRQLHVTMSGFWATLPVYVRHKWLQELWQLYARLAEAYEINPNRKCISLFQYDNPSVVVGHRTPWESWVDGGPKHQYNLINKVQHPDPAQTVPTNERRVP